MCVSLCILKVSNTVANSHNRFLNSLQIINQPTRWLLFIYVFKWWVNECNWHFLTSQWSLLLSVLYILHFDLHKLNKCITIQVLAKRVDFQSPNKEKTSQHLTHITPLIECIDLKRMSVETIMISMKYIYVAYMIFSKWPNRISVKIV